MSSYYDPHNHYWRRGDGTLFSSAARVEVHDDDGAYLAWAEAGGVPTAYPRDPDGAESAAELAAVLAPYEIYVTLDDLAAATIVQIDADAEAARLRFVTPGAAQAMVYLEKRQQAAAALAAYDADNPPPEGLYPLLECDVPATAGTVIEVAQIVAANAAAWSVIASQIEALRLNAKAAVAEALAADDPDAIRAAAVIDWPSPAPASAGG